MKIENPCQHETWINGGLGVIVKSDADAFAALFPTPPTTIEVQFCWECGALRLEPSALVKVKHGLQ